jgi:hypothetical protein
MTDYSKPIQSRKQAIDFILRLCADDKLFHFDDDPHDFKMFEIYEADNLVGRVDELFRYLKDPHKVSVALMEIYHEHD